MCAVKSQCEQCSNGITFCIVQIHWRSGWWQPGWLRVVVKPNVAASQVQPCKPAAFTGPGQV
jgi:hypothetical protein